MRIEALDDILANCEEEGDCQLWLGRVDADGTPVFTESGSTVSVRRRAYELGRGPVPAGKKVTDRACSQRCCNPAHLVALTPKKLLARNMKRMAPDGAARRLAAQRKGRKITMDIAREIRASSESVKALSQRHNLNESTIRRIQAGETWAEAADVAARTQSAMLAVSAFNPATLMLATGSMNL